MTADLSDPHDEERIIRERRAKLAALRAEGFTFSPFRGARDARAGELHAHFDGRSAEELQRESIRLTLCGRVMGRRVMGGIAFLDLHDETGRIQLHVVRSRLPPETWRLIVKTVDIGDIVSAAGSLMKTKAGELSLDVSGFDLLVKNIRPLPEKHHGLRDPEQRYRRRYVDLMVNPRARALAVLRSQTVATIRRYLDTLGFLEVETPMMHVIPGGATARPFVTHHHALDLTLYLRIAPELYLKRLIVGGFERVYEINRNFRNEGISSRHNPEFTMLELYQAYTDWVGIMDLTEHLLRHTARTVLGVTRLPPRSVDSEPTVDLAPAFARRRMDELVAERLGLDSTTALRERSSLARFSEQRGIPFTDRDGAGRLLSNLFESLVEPTLVQPIFVTHYPLEVSPLAQVDPNDPFFTERFELYLHGRELANGFSELNDPEDQERRFRAQLAELERGDEEAMHYDADYIEALEYGMPPTGGLGIGIDRLVMALGGAESIREVLLFPLLKPEQASTEVSQSLSE